MSTPRRPLAKAHAANYTPRSALSATPRSKTPKKKPSWDDTIHDLSQFKLTPTEHQRRQEAIQRCTVSDSKLYQHEHRYDDFYTPIKHAYEEDDADEYAPMDAEQRLRQFLADKENRGELPAALHSVRRATIGGAVVPSGNEVNVDAEMKQFERKHPSMARTLIRPPPLHRKLKQIIAPSAAQHHQFQGEYGAPLPFQDTLPIEAMRDVVRAVNKLARSMNRDCIMDDVSPDAMEDWSPQETFRNCIHAVHALAQTVQQDYVKSRNEEELRRVNKKLQMLELGQAEQEQAMEIEQKEKEKTKKEISRLSTQLQQAEQRLEETQEKLTLLMREQQQHLLVTSVRNMLYGMDANEHDARPVTSQQDVSILDDLTADYDEPESMLQHDDDSDSQDSDFNTSPVLKSKKAVHFADVSERCGDDSFGHDAVRAKATPTKTRPPSSIARNSPMQLKMMDTGPVFQQWIPLDDD